MGNYLKHPVVKKLIRIIFIALVAAGWFFVLLPFSKSLSFLTAAKIEELIKAPAYSLVFQLDSAFFPFFQIIFSILTPSVILKYMGREKEKTTPEAKGRYFFLVIIQLIIIFLGFSIWVVGPSKLN